jgi:hypothetical protein
MKKLIAIITIILALGLFGLSQVKGQNQETGQKRNQMTQMMGMMKNMDMKMDNMMNNCMGMMQRMQGSKGEKGGMMMERHMGDN